MQPFCVIQWWTHGIGRLSKHRECATPAGSPGGNNGLWVTMTACGFTDCNERTTLVGDAANRGDGGAGGAGGV